MLLVDRSRSFTMYECLAFVQLFHVRTHLSQQKLSYNLVLSWRPFPPSFKRLNQFCAARILILPGFSISLISFDAFLAVSHFSTHNIKMALIVIVFTSHYQIIKIKIK